MRERAGERYFRCRANRSKLDDSAQDGHLEDKRPSVRPRVHVCEPTICFGCQRGGEMGERLGRETDGDCQVKEEEEEEEEERRGR